jgi:hypothetical protein
MSKLRITPVADTAETGVEQVYRGVKLKIARANNTRFKKIFRRLTQPYSDQLAKGTMDEQVSEEIYLQCVADSILVDWSDFKVDGEEIHYTVENAIELLKNDKDCLDFVMAFANNLDNFLIRDEEELKGK